MLDNYFYILGEYGITSIIVHHEGKTIGYEGTDKGRGASTTTDVMSNHWSMRREKDKTSQSEYVVIECLKARNYQKFDAITLDIVGGVYFRKTDSLHDPVKLVQMLYEVGGQLETQGEFVKLIMKTLNVSKGKSQAIIKEAVSKQLVVVDKYGQNKSRYRLPAYDKAA